MKRYTTRNNSLAKLLVVALATSLFAVSSCTDEFEKTNKEHNLSMDFSTRAGEAADLIQRMRLFTFNEGLPNDKMFHGEILNIARTTDKVTAQVETGYWNLAMVSALSDITIVAPTSNNEMSKLKMYEYTPTVTSQRSSNADEIFLENKLTPNITSNGSHNMIAQLNRTVAKVELIIEKTTPNFNLNGEHKIQLHNVPSKISYTGALLPNQNEPDTLGAALQAPIELRNANNGSYEGTETITFLIPAHRGSDYLNVVSADTITLKMDVTVDLERTGGTRFVKQAEIPLVAQCNKTLRVKISVNDGLEFKTEVLNWQGVELGATVGEGYQNWLYVKKDATGTGISWKDALPDINTAITKATALMSTETVHGILVAGGESLAYTEGLALPANVKIFGGWIGTPGTELGPNDGEAPYKIIDASVRNLSTHKAYLKLDDKTVQLANANTVLDGFVIEGAAVANTSVVTVSNATAWLNAVEIKNNQNTSGYALSLTGTNTVATNVLVSNNTRGVNVGAGAKLVNATITSNGAASAFNGSLLNSVYWGNTGTPTTGGTINYCAFNGVHGGMPTGTNYPMHSTDNAAWFVSGSYLPGPHFRDINSDYTALSNRAPMLGRGDDDTFTAEVTGKMPLTHLTDINGNSRLCEGIDIGCYESTGMEGFSFRWNMTDVYISTKKEIVSDHPAILFNNSEGAYIEWRIEAAPISNLFTMEGSNTGAGTGTTLGYFKLKSGPTANEGNSDRTCGEVTFISDNMGLYLPNDKKTVYQTPGTSAVWNEGYAGSFHRWNETGPRYIFGEHPANAEWTVRIISGHEWIKIDGGSRPSNPDQDTEVVESFGGTVSGTGDIVFRVGMKSTLASESTTPRYGLLSITKRIKGYNSSGTSTGWTPNVGNALFFVRQGEAPDYLYRPTEDPRDAYNKNRSRHETGREQASKFAVYNMTDPNGGFNTNGVPLNNRGGGFVSHPSKTGYYFKWNDLRAYYPDNSRAGTNVYTSDYWASCDFSSEREVCPSGYHTPTDPEWVHSYFLARVTGNFDTYGTGEGADGTTFVWGRYADGYYDRIANDGSGYVGTGPDRAADGLLMYNDFNNASVFFPTAARRTSSSTIENETSGRRISWYFTSSPKGSNSDGNRYNNTTNQAWGTHSYGVGNTGHLGMSCTSLYKYQAASIRCVKDGN